MRFCGLGEVDEKCTTRLEWGSSGSDMVRRWRAVRVRKG